MQNKCCFFIGHREAPEELQPAIKAAVEKLIVGQGVTEFIAGHYGNFDRLAAKAVISAKSEHPEISLFLLLPYHPAIQPIKIPAGFDGTYYPPGMESVPRRFAISKANRYMVDHSAYLIAYAWHPASNAKTLVEYAKQREQKNLLTVYNLAEKG